MKNKHIAAHMKSAFNYAECSTAERLKVGCVIVKDDRIISIGYNGMPSGWTNVCEDEDFVTKPEVLHAEENAITKLARSNESGEGATAFITHAPCLSCAKAVILIRYNRVYCIEILIGFPHEYRDTAGVNFLKKCKIGVNHYNAND
jgi:dCMP deaminase